MEDRMISRTAISTMALVLLAAAASPDTIRAQDDDFITDLLNACSQEIRTFCAQVTPGEGRLFACFAVHEDRLSENCAGALHEVAPRLGAMANSIAFIERSCKIDIERSCADVELGKGRFTRCLKAQYKDATPICQQALTGIGMHE
jgi:Golgi apparatus protein 1